ncbi:glycoside hydrolase family 25 protein [Mucilaginibacter sp. UYCu711]|uniref:glycoside hydrolase family 25 protein n=1 Tax=Mucilaginibacter sp. UYCu711 TaxID=3156339 RepID=UPI003D24875B
MLLTLLSPFYYGYLVKIFSSTWQCIRDIGLTYNYRTYERFNIPIPARYSIHGIDVSYAQGKIDWQKVSSMKEKSVYLSFAFIKATEGLLTVDPYFKRNWHEASKVGIVCGPYHFFRANKNGLWQARFFLQNINIKSGDLPPVVDIEQLDGISPNRMRKELKQFLLRVEASTHVKPIIYTGLSFYSDYLSGYFNSYPLWIAHYYQKELHTDKNTNWLFWQHSDLARINGINHTVDFDSFKGDTVSFQRLLLR